MACRTGTKQVWIAGEERATRVKTVGDASSIPIVVAVIVQSRAGIALRKMAGLRAASKWTRTSPAAIASRTAWSRMSIAGGNVFRAV